MVYRVADEVHQRLAQLVDHRLVDPRLLALQHQLHGLALVVGEVTHQPREALEDVADRQHPHVHDRLLQLAGDGTHLVHRLQELRPGAGDGGRDLAAQLGELGAVHDQLADQVQQLIELGEVDPHHAGAGPGGGRHVDRLGGGGGRFSGGSGGSGRGLGRGALRLRRRRRRGLRRGAGRRVGRRRPGPCRQQSGQLGLLGLQRALFGAARAGGLDGVAQGARSPQQAVDARSVEPQGAVAGAGEHLLQPVDVILDGAEAHHPAVALERVQRAEERAQQLGADPLSFQAQQDAVEDGQVLPRILEVDADELGGDLERHHQPPPGAPFLTAR